MVVLMTDEIVRYSNQFNNQALRKFTALDLDLLMAIASRVRNKGANEVTFTFGELRRLAGLQKNLTNDEIAKTLIGVNRRLLALNFEFTDGGTTIQFTLFSGFETNARKATLLAAVNPRYAFLFNDLTSGFTRFELGQFTALKSTYAKECYRRLKQYRKTGLWRVSLREFRRLLDVPKSYRTSNINQFVLKPIEDELGPLMGLKVHRKFMKTRPGRGRASLVGFEFEFDVDYDFRERTAPQLDVSNAVQQDEAAREGRKSLREVPSSAPKVDVSLPEDNRFDGAAEWFAAHGGHGFAGAEGYVDPGDQLDL